jgi:hypothetical protein
MKKTFIGSCLVIYLLSIFLATSAFSAKGSESTASIGDSNIAGDEKNPAVSDGLQSDGLQPTARGYNKLQFQYLAFPDIVSVDSLGSLEICLVNRGPGMALLYDGAGNFDQVVIYLPVGPMSGDLVDNTVGLSCSSPQNGSWVCEKPEVSGDEVLLTIRPNGRVYVDTGEAICFKVEGVDINAVTGLASLYVDQQISPYRADEPVNRWIDIFKTSTVIDHVTRADTATHADTAANADHATTADSATHATRADTAANADTANNATEAGHAKTADSATSATNAEHAATAGDADTVDGKHASEFLDTSSDTQTKSGGLNVSGKIGIGTTNPLAKLNVKDGTDTNFLVSVAWPEAGGVGVGLNAVNDALNANVPMVFGASKFYFDAGNVGIGTKNPTHKLHVYGDDGEIKIESPNSGSLSNARFVLSVGNEPAWGQGAALQLDGPSLSALPNGLELINRTNGPLVFGTNNLWRMRITSGGNVGIGTDSPSYKLHVIGDIAYTGNIYDVSDFRLKENVTPLTDAIEKVSALRGIYFSLKGESPSKREVGVIAQEVEAVLPEAVSEDAEGYKSVDYSKLTPLLIEATKAQQAIIEKQQAQIEALQARIEALESR